MSYEKVKSLSVNEKKQTVYITSCSNNVFPQEYKRWHCDYLADMLKEQGREAVDLYLLEQYQGGMLQGGNNEYRQTLSVYGAATLENLNKLRKLKADTKGEKYFITHGQSYIGKITRKGATLYRDIRWAKQFTMIDALVKSKNFSDVQIIPATGV